MQNSTASAPAPVPGLEIFQLQNQRDEAVALILRIAARLNTKPNPTHVVAVCLSRAGRIEVQVVDLQDRVVFTLRSGMELKLRHVLPDKNWPPYSPGVFLSVEKSAERPEIVLLEQEALIDCVAFLSTL